VPNAERKQTRREMKAVKQAAREAARRAERRRALATAGIVAAVLLVGGGLIAFTVFEEQQAAAEQEQQAAQAASEAARQASEAAEEVAGREVACDAEAPATAADERRTFDEPEQVLEEGTDYGAAIVTSCGEVTIDLAEDRAPETVNSFVFLVQQGFFDGLEIFRNATSIGALQTGSGTNEANWQIGYTLPDELDLAESEGYPPGAVAMANAGPDTGGSQFFFVYNDQFALEPSYTRFAMVTDGLDVLEEIGAIGTIGPSGETPGEVVYIESVEIVEGPAGDGDAAPKADRADDGGGSEGSDGR
jgi:peptidyl-prolyl cis-trans isomerase B (cyclophilin B)